MKIEPDEPGYELRSFECVGCGRQECVQTPSPWQVKTRTPFHDRGRKDALPD